MQKQSLAILALFPILLATPLACSSSSSNPSEDFSDDADGGGGGGGKGNGDGGGATSSSDSGGSGNDDSGITFNDSGALADAGSGITGCGDLGDPGNSAGVGKYCTITCPSGLLCATLGGDDTQTFCTKLCTPSDAGPNPCGPGATCQCQGAQCGCTPNACL